MSNENLFCLECDVLLLRLYNKPDLAAVQSGSTVTPASADKTETYTCPKCGKVVVRSATDTTTAPHV